ncbi:MAG: HAMP domain-containing sensor histidine kinase [Burkholderiales bacterium]
MAGVAMLPFSWSPPQGVAANAFWVSLKYFNFYRIAVAAVFLLALAIYRDTLNLGSHDPVLFVYTSTLYLALAVLFHVVLRKLPAYFNLQLTLHVVSDIVALILLMYASGGIRSGLGVMLLISLAGAALVSRGTLVLFYAALASIAALLEQSYWVLVHDSSTADFLQPGLLSIGYFATALITNQLAQRVITNERVARQRGADLANQLRINRLVIQDVQDGVLVVDANGLVHQHNRQVSVLLGRQAPELGQIEEYSEEIAQKLAAWRSTGGQSVVSMRLADSGRLVRARFAAAGGTGSSFSLVFLEDLSRLQEQARQLKLAALGRLTANIAHEIRNPLSAITYAGDLLQEESRAPQKERLAQIIRDNAQRLDRMVRDVLELSRRDRIQPETLRMRQFLLTFLDEFAQNEDVPRASFGVEATNDITVEFDRVHLNQVLWNLLRNAWRHCRKQPESVRLQSFRRGNRVELHITDDGSGVSRELQAQLFEPFFTTFASGTGLGLYIARELCAANGASLDYLDGNHGADFRILWQAA